MTLQDLLKECNFKVNDIKSRIDNDTIVVNGVVVTDSKLELGNISEIITSGSFLHRMMDNGIFEKFKNTIPVFGLCNLMSGESNLKGELIEFLRDWKMIEVADKSGLFVRLVEPSPEGILFDLEGDKPVHRKVVIREFVEIDIDKVRSDLEKVNKQLSNPGFVNKAPKFKVDEAKARKARLETKLGELSL